MAKVSLSLPDDVVRVIGGGDRGRAAAVIKELSVEFAVARGRLEARRGDVERVLALLVDHVNRRVLSGGAPSMGDLRAALALSSSLLTLLKGTEVTGAERSILEALESEVSVAFKVLDMAEEALGELSKMRGAVEALSEALGSKSPVAGLLDKMESFILAEAKAAVIGVAYRIMKYAQGKLRDLEGAAGLLESLEGALRSMHDALLEGIQSRGGGGSSPIHS